MSGGERRCIMVLERVRLWLDLFHQAYLSLGLKWRP